MGFLGQYSPDHVAPWQRWLRRFPETFANSRRGVRNPGDATTLGMSAGVPVTQPPVVGMIFARRSELDAAVVEARFPPGGNACSLLSS
jgi:hypothetical protein